MHDALQKCVKDLQSNMEVGYWKIKDHQGEKEGDIYSCKFKDSQKSHMYREVDQINSKNIQTLERVFTCNIFLPTKNKQQYSG